MVQHCFFNKPQRYLIITLFPKIFLNCSPLNDNLTNKQSSDEQLGMNVLFYSYGGLANKFVESTPEEFDELWMSSYYANLLGDFIIITINNVSFYFICSHKCDRSRRN